MARKSKPVRQQAKDEEKKTPQVNKYDYFAKAKLAAYCGEDGVPFYLGKEQDEKDFLKLDSIRASRTGKNEELFRRIGMGLTLDAASINAGFKLLAKHFQGEWPQPVEAGVAKVGLPQLRAFLSTPEGSKLADAIAVLNVGKTGRPKEKRVQEAVEHIVAFATDGAEGLVKHLGRLASSAATLYLCSMTLLKDLALFGDLAAWAENMEGDQSKVVKEWIRRPQDESKLCKALVKEVMTKVSKNQREAGKKRKASQSSVAKSATTASSDSSSGGGSSSSSAKGKKRKQRAPSSEKSKDNKKKADKSPTKKKKKQQTSSSGTAKKARKSKTDDKKTKDRKDKKHRKKSKTSEKSGDTEKPQTEVPGKAPVPEADKITAAFTVWSQGDVQLLAAAVAEEKTRVGSLPTGVVPWPLLQGFIDRVPTAVQDCFPALAALRAEVGDASEVSNVFAKKVLARLAVITSEAEALFEEQSGAAAGSTAE